MPRVSTGHGIGRELQSLWSVPDFTQGNTLGGYQTRYGLRYVSTGHGIVTDIASRPMPVPDSGEQSGDRLGDTLCPYKT
eukprot:2963511-Rhodomonas_salina.2